MFCLLRTVSLAIMYGVVDHNVWSRFPMRACLFDIEHQSLEVFAFWVVDVDWVVGWLVQLVQYADFASCLCCSSEYCIAEIVFCHYLRTAEREEYAAWLDFLECFLVEACVAFQCIAQCVLVLGECRWIENDEVVCRSFR